MIPQVLINRAQNTFDEQLMIREQLRCISAKLGKERKILRQFEADQDRKNSRLMRSSISELKTKMKMLTLAYDQNALYLKRIDKEILQFAPTTYKNYLNN